MIGAPPLAEADLHAFETFVLPRYLSFFGAMAAELLLPHDPATIAHLGCRTGYPDVVLDDRCRSGELVGLDPSPAAVELARSKAHNLARLRATYQVAQTLPTPLAPESFTHALCLHPMGTARARAELLAEMYRLLAYGGQAIVALPLRGSFPEINDMVREFALRNDLTELGRAIDAAAASRPNIETVSEEFENAGLHEVDVDVQLVAVSFANGREFLDDAIARLMVLPDLRAILEARAEQVDGSLRYAHEAIAKYWSEGVFELTVNVGCVSGRRL